MQAGAVKVELQDENRIRQVLGFDPVDEKAREERQESAQDMFGGKPGEKEDETKENEPDETEPDKEDKDDQPKPETDKKQNTVNTAVDAQVDEVNTDIVPKYYAAFNKKALTEMFDTHEEAAVARVGKILNASIDDLLDEIQGESVIYTLGVGCDVECYDYVLSLQKLQHLDSDDDITVIWFDFPEVRDMLDGNIGDVTLTLNITLEDGTVLLSGSDTIIVTK